MPRRYRSLTSPLVLLSFAVVTLAVGRFGAYVTAPSLQSWYPSLAKPAYTPPDWAFPVAWTLLYLLMAIAAWQVWRVGERERMATAMTLFFVQLGLNGLWSYCFFGLRRLDLALIDAVALSAAVVATILAFQRHSKAASWLMLPYLAWVLFATLLTYDVWRLNR